MHFTIPKEGLLNALTRCNAIAPAKPSQPILSHVHLVPGEEILRIRATDLDISYETAIANLVWLGTAEAGHPACLPAARLLEIVKAIPVTMIDIACSDHGCQTYTISGGTASFVLQGLDPEEFPARITFDQVEVLTINGQDLRRVLGHVRYCQSSDCTKPNLHGTLLKFEENDEGDVFTFSAATDGHRLCCDTASLSDSCGETELPPLEFSDQLAAGIIIPTKAVEEIMSMTVDGPWVIGTSASAINISSGDETLSLRLGAGDFPDVNRVIPTGFTSTVSLKRQPFIDAIKRVRIATEKNSDYRGIDIAIDGESMQLSARNPMAGIEGTDILAVQTTGEPEPVKVSSDYLLQALGNLPGATVQIHFVNATSPLMITPEGTDFPQAIIMPMRGA